MKTSILRQLAAMSLLLACLALLHACGAQAGNNQRSAASAHSAAPPARTVTLTRGQSIIVPASAAPATLRLERVNDSRCRVGAVCVWAGYISYSFSLTHADGSVSNFVLSDNMPGASSRIRQNGLSIALAGVEPQAAPAKNEAPPDYRVSLRVSNTE